MASVVFFKKLTTKIMSLAQAPSLKRSLELLTDYLLQTTESVEKPFFVKVGANDGITGDPCGDLFLRNGNWRGILIEPVPYCARRLASVYSDRRRFIIEEVAIGGSPGSAEFFYVSEKAASALPDLPVWHDQLGSFDRQHILKHLSGVLEPYIVTRTVTVETLDGLLGRHGVRTVEFLHIDAEGHDLQVLQTLDFERYQPGAIFLEQKHLSLEDRAEVQTLLRRQGYGVRRAGGDLLALHQPTRPFEN